MTAFETGQAVTFRLASELRNFEHRGRFLSMATAVSAYVRDDAGPSFVVNLADIEPAPSTPVADALQRVDQARAEYIAAGYHGTDEYLDELEKLADAVRSHGIGAELGQLREQRAEPAPPLPCRECGNTPCVYPCAPGPRAYVPPF